MKIRRSAATTALVVTGAYAQDAYQQSWTTSNSSVMPSMTPPVSYTTVTYSDCSTGSMSSLITITEGITITHCPECTMQSAGYQSGYTTVYTTTYMSLCPTGTVPATYTVTESCTEATPTWTPGPSHIPNGFTVTTKECTVCDTTPTTVTITEPCGCEATEGVPVTNTATTTNGSGSGSGGSMPAGTTSASSPSNSGSGSGSASPSGNSMPSCSGDECGGSGNQSGTSPSPAPGGSGSAAPPYPTTATQTCPGPQCRAAASSYPSGVTYGNTSGIVPSTGAGTSGYESMGAFTSLFLAVAVAALAFKL